MSKNLPAALGRFSQPSLLILAVLMAGENHGYGIMQELERRGNLRVGAGTLYGTLARLQEDGFIEPFDLQDRRTLYAITARGRTAFCEQTGELRQFASLLSKLAKA